MRSQSACGNVWSWGARLSFALVALLGGPAGLAVLSTQAAPPLTDAELQEALAAYEKDPLGAAGTTAAGVLMKFAEEDKRVRIVFFEESAPWMLQDESGNPTTELMAAFVVGNIKAQLAAGRPAMNSYAGTLEVFRIYQRLKQAHDSLKIPAIEKFLAMEKAGKLRAYLDEVDAKHAREDPHAPSSEPELPEA
jgi:hypothetical protein